MCVSIEYDLIPFVDLIKDLWQVYADKIDTEVHVFNEHLIRIIPLNYEFRDLFDLDVCFTMIDDVLSDLEVLYDFILYDSISDHHSCEVIHCDLVV